MKKIGIIGGAGPLASSLLYKMIIEKCYQNGCKHSGKIPEMMLINYPFTREHCVKCGPMQQPQAIQLLQHCINQLIVHEVDMVAIACNTLHLFLDSVSLKSKKLIHISQTALNSTKITGLKNMLIVGTSTTIHNNLYKHPTIACIAPSHQAQKDIDNIIGRILEGRVLQRDANVLSAIINRECTNQHCNGVILGCTELPVLHHAYPLTIKPPIVLIDTIDELAQTVVQNALNSKRI